ncbi:ABC transporter ATP-binding protein [Gracilibacillus kekensis]|uniref:Iron complex transport system ATP-binding protein n=1 Tax=Gracilibacillus kekensis TaxID=1027249 RepID=A0A1M7LFS3_9BACI|nr:ABC transporter ATP-binding protein [Gracilibacillus kekensis]SHM76993.1 iron complex transport system ATP-binding protein [Gracilibacillus kekensis]
MLELRVKDVMVELDKHIIIDSVSARFTEGTVNSVIGVNGAGKTVFVKAIANLLPHQGSISIIDRGRELDRKKIAYVPQMTAINSELTVFEMILLGKVLHLTWRVEKELLREVELLLNRMKLSQLSNKRFSTLSGGQKQMVIMAQSIIAKPKVLLLDEPTSALDLKHQIELLDMSKEYAEENQAICLVIMHDLSLVSRYSDTVVVLHKGTLFKHDLPKHVMEQNLLEQVYGVEVEVTETKKGFKAITPLNVSIR